MMKDLTAENIKRHIVAELLLYKHEKLRNDPALKTTKEFWDFEMFYKEEINADIIAHDIPEDDTNGIIESIERFISKDDFMNEFYRNWEKYDTDLPVNGGHSLVYTFLSIKLLLAKSLKYADDIDLRDAINRLNDRLN